MSEINEFTLLLQDMRKVEGAFVSIAGLAKSFRDGSLAADADNVLTQWRDLERRLERLEAAEDFFGSAAIDCRSHKPRWLN
jgi:hypothetical protein